MPTKSVPACKGDPDESCKGPIYYGEKCPLLSACTLDNEAIKVMTSIGCWSLRLDKTLPLYKLRESTWIKVSEKWMIRAGAF